MADPDYFTLAELNALPGMTDPKYTDARKLGAAAWVTGIIERECNTSFVPRPKTRTFSGYGTTTLMLPDPFVRSITSINVGGNVIAPAGVAFGDGVLRFTGNGLWSLGKDNVTISWVSGYSDVPPGDIKEAALQGTRLRLFATNSNSVNDSRQRSITNDAGTFQLTIADKDHPTGWPEVDAVISAWADQLDVYGFA